MQNKTQNQTKITVDGITYLVQFYSPSFGMELWTKIVRLLGAPIIKLVGVFQGDKVKGKKFADIMNLEFEDLNMEGAEGALAALLSNLKPGEIVPLLHEILSSTFMTTAGNVNDCVADQFDSPVFAGRYMHLFKLAGKTLGVQYPDFLSALSKQARGAKLAQATSQKPVE